MAATRAALRRGVCTESGLSACFAAEQKNAGVREDAGISFLCRACLRAMWALIDPS
jgi:hypothetical protein